MSTLDDPEIPPADRRAARAALALDPVLEDEVELIAGQLAPERRRAFWRAFAACCRGRRHPAAAVLEALERVASGGA